MGLGTAIARRFLAYSVTIMAPPAITSNEKMSTSSTTTTTTTTTTSPPLSPLSSLPKKNAADLLMMPVQRASEVVAVTNCSGEKINGNNSIISGLTLNGGGSQSTLILNGKSPEVSNFNSITANEIENGTVDNVNKSDHCHRNHYNDSSSGPSVAFTSAITTTTSITSTKSTATAATQISNNSSTSISGSFPFSHQTETPLPIPNSVFSLPLPPSLESKTTTTTTTTSSSSSLATNENVANGLLKSSNTFNGVSNNCNIFASNKQQQQQQHDEQQLHSVNIDTESLIKIEKNEFECFFDSVLSNHRKTLDSIKTEEETKTKFEWNNDGALDNKDEKSTKIAKVGNNESNGGGGGGGADDYKNCWNNNCNENGLFTNTISAATAAAAAETAVNHNNDDFDSANVEDVLQVLKSMESKSSVDDHNSAVPLNSMVPSCSVGIVVQDENKNGNDNDNDDDHDNNDDQQILLPNDDMSDLLFLKLNGDDDMFTAAAKAASLPLNHYDQQPMDCCDHNDSGSVLQNDNMIVNATPDVYSEESIQTSINSLSLEQNHFENRLNSLQNKLRFMQCKILGQIGCREIEYFLSYMHDRTKFQTETAGLFASNANGYMIDGGGGGSMAIENVNNVVDSTILPEPITANRIPKFDMKKFIKIYDLPSMMTSMKSTVYNKQRKSLLHQNQKQQQRQNGIRNSTSNMATNHVVLASMLTSQSTIGSGTSSTSTRSTAASNRQAAAAAATAAAGNYFHTIVNHSANFMEFSSSLPKTTLTANDNCSGTNNVTVTHSNQFPRHLSSLSHTKSVNIIRPKLANSSSQQMPLSFSVSASTSASASTSTNATFTKTTTPYSSSLPLKSFDVSFVKQQQQQQQNQLQQKNQFKKIPSTSTSLLSLTSTPVTKTSSLKSSPQPIELAKLNIEQSSNLTQMASNYCSQFNRILTDIDSDKTESSSDAESCDEMQNYQNIYQQSVSIKERSAWHYARERARIGSRWSWTESQLADVSNRIRQINEHINHVRKMYSPVEFESIDANNTITTTTTATVSNLCTNQTTLTQNSNSSLEESFSAHFQNSSNNNSDNKISENEENEQWRQHQQEKELANLKSSRTQPFRSNKFRKRKLISMYGLHQQSKKISKPSTVRCFCQPPYTYCVICTGRVDPKLSKDDLRSSLFPDDNIELLDHHYHKSLSTLQDVSQHIHLESITKYSEWQQRVLKGGLKLHKIPKKDTKYLAAAAAAAAAATAAAVTSANAAASVSITALADQISSMSNVTAASVSSRIGMQSHSKVRKTDHFLQKRKYMRHVRNSNSNLQRRNKAKNRKIKFGQYMSSFHSEGGGEGKSGSFRGMDDDEEEFEEYGSTGLNGHSSASHRRSRNDSFNIDNIVIPYSVAAATRVEVLQYKEIQTPQWRLTDEVFTDENINSDVVMSSSTISETDSKMQLSKNPDETEVEDEDLDDNVFLTRHELCEKGEHNKFSNYLKFPVPTRSTRYHHHNHQNHHHQQQHQQQHHGSVVATKVNDDITQALSQSNSNDSFQCTRRSISPSSCPSPQSQHHHHHQQQQQPHFSHLNEEISSSSCLSSASPSPLPNTTTVPNFYNPINNPQSKRKSASFQFDPNFFNMISSVPVSPFVSASPYEHVRFPVLETEWTEMQEEKTFDEELSLLCVESTEEPDQSVNDETAAAAVGEKNTNTNTAVVTSIVDAQNVVAETDASKTLELSVSTAVVDGNVSEVVQKSNLEENVDLTSSKIEQQDIVPSSSPKQKQCVPNGRRESNSSTVETPARQERVEDDDFEVGEEDDDDDVADEDYNEDEDDDEEEEEEEEEVDEDDDDEEEEEDDGDETSIGDASRNESDGNEIVDNDDDDNDDNEGHKDPEWNA